MDIVSKSEKETAVIAGKIADEVKGGDILALRGQLGAGKTVFAKYFAKALGISAEITSPTFVIMKSYKFTKAGKNLNLIHVDAYRLDSADQAESIGLKEFVLDQNNVIIIEWPEKIWPLIPAWAKIIDIEYLDETRRRISIDEGQNVYLS